MISGVSEEFLDPSFDLDEWLSSAAVGCDERGLERLRDSLAVSANSITQQLVATINTDYQGFVQLSSQLEGFESAVHQLRPPLHTASKDLSAVVTSLDDRIQRLTAVLRRRQTSEQSTRMLTDFVRGSELVDSVEKAVHRRTATAAEDDTVSSNAHTGGKVEHGDDDGQTAPCHAVDPFDLFDDEMQSDDECDASHPTPDTVTDTDTATYTSPYTTAATATTATSPSVDVDDETSAALLFRTASWFGELSDLTAKHGSLPFFRVLRPRIDDAHTVFASKLRASLRSMLQPGRLCGSNTALEHCFRAFVAFGASELAEDTVRSVVVLPFLRNTFTHGRVDSGSRGSFRGLPELFSETVSFLREQCAGLVSAAQAVAGIDVVGNGVWNPIVDTLMTDVPDLFSSAFAPTFHSNYVAFSRFYAELTAVVGDVLAGHPDTARIHAKWARALPVYSGVRFREITDPLVAACRGSPAALSTTAVLTCTSVSVLMGPSVALWDAVLRCWASDVFLPSLLTSSATVTHQLLRRYAVWVEMEVLGGGGAGGAGASLSVPVSVRLAAAHDCQVLFSAVKSVLLPTIGAATRRSVLTGSDDPKSPDTTTAATDCPSAVSDVVLAAADSLSACVPSVLRCVSASVAQSCSSSLGAVQSLSRQYSMTNKPVPTKPSPYVGRVVQPLSDVLSSCHDSLSVASGSAPDGIDGFVFAVLEPVCAAYEAAVAELMASVENLTKSLGWLKPTGGGGSDDSSTITDRDKIIRQVELDTAHLTVLVGNLGVSDTARLDALTARLARSAHASPASAPQ